MKTQEKGQIIVILALALVAILGITALAVDGSMIYAERRDDQSTADSSALSAAQTASASLTCATARTAAINQAITYASAQEGVALVNDSTSPSRVEANCNADNTKLTIKVVVTSNTNTTFAKMVSRNQLQTTVESISQVTFGTQSWGGNYGLVALNKTSINTISMTGSGSIRIDQGDIFDNSNHGTQALSFTGSGSISAPAGNIRIVGGYKKTGSGSISPTPISTSQINDPWAAWAAANTPIAVEPICDLTADYSGSTNHTISPGNYTKIKITGSGALTLNPGVYNICNGGNFSISGSSPTTLGNSSNGVIINLFGNAYVSQTGSGSFTAPYGLTMNILGTGDLDLAGSGSLTATGAGGFFAYVNSGEFNMTGSGSFNVKAPTSGTYANMSLFSKGSVIRITGSGSSMSYGSFYAPNAECSLTGSGSSGVFHSQYICNTVDVTGSGSFNLTYDSSENFSIASIPIVELLK